MCPPEPRDAIMPTRAPARVLMVSMHTGVLDRRIVAQINALMAAGYGVTLVSTPVSLSGTGIDPRARVVVPTGTSTPGLRTRLVGVYKALPLPVRLLRRDAWFLLRPGALPSGTGTLVELARGIEADVVHAHDLEALPAAALIRDRLARTSPRPSLVYDSHELFSESEPGLAYRRYWNGVERRWIGQADAIITVNDSIADELARRWGVPRPAVLMNSLPPAPPGPVRTRADLARLLGVPAERVEGQKLVLFQGSLRPGLNIENLVRAAGALPSGMVLVMLGRGVLERRIDALIARHAPGRVLRRAWIEPDELLGYTALADLGVIPYQASCLNNHLATPGKLFEYAHAGVPVCAHDLPEVRRLLTAHRLGAVYDFSSPASITHAICDALARAQRGEFIGVRDPRMLEPISWPAQERVLLEVYARLGGGGTPARAASASQ